MKIQKQEILDVVRQLPEQISVEEVMERLLILAKVEKGLKEANSGKVVSHVEAEKRMEKWLR